jgi:predicted CoA-binding protein
MFTEKMVRKTLVIGASFNESRYSNIAIHKLKANNHFVEAIGLTKGTIADVIVNTERILFGNIDTITLYLSPLNQKKFYNYVVNLKPSRVIFNPGTENKEFENILEQNGIKTEIACTLVLLSTNQY